MFHYFANPTRFMRFSNAIFPYIIITCTLLISLGLWYGLINSPPDYLQGESVRIMYIHVPSAWMSLFVYFFITVFSISFLIWRHPLASMAAYESTKIGAIFTLITLCTGSLWGKPTWGTWWVWDARLTSVLLLFFIYLALMTLPKAFNDLDKGDNAFSILALFGAFNLPIIKFSVDWWNTLHQPASVFRRGGVAINEEMLLPLLLMASAFMLLYIILLIIGIDASLHYRKYRALVINKLNKNQIS